MQKVSLDTVNKNGVETITTVRDAQDVAIDLMPLHFQLGLEDYGLHGVTLDKHTLTVHFVSLYPKVTRSKVKK